MTALNHRKADRQGSGEISQAASYLSGQACTLSARHIQDAMLRLQFNREVAYYAQGIVKDVNDGRKSVEEGLQAIGEEQQSLIKQSSILGQQGIGLVAGSLQISGGIALCAGSIGTACAFGALMVLHGANNMYENGNNLWEGRNDSEGWIRIGYQRLARLVNQGDREGNISYGLMDLTTSGYSLGRLVLKKDTWRLFRYVRTDYERGFQQMSRSALGLEMMSDALTLKNTYQESEK